MTDDPGLSGASGRGDRHATDRLFALLYEDLHRMARNRMRQSGELTLLDTTALVHESFLRVQGVKALDFPDSRHFLAYASRVMRTVVVDLVRERQAERHGGQVAHVTYDTGLVDGLTRHEDEVLRVHESLDALAETDPRAASVVELRYFGGLSEAEIAAHLEVTERTVQRDWNKARLFLSLALK
jgi:RNA polymerase sigma factor (TIGR02999 family)